MRRKVNRAQSKLDSLRAASAKMQHPKLAHPKLARKLRPSGVWEFVKLP